MDKAMKQYMLVATVAILIAVALIASAFYLGNYFEEQETAFIEQDQVKFDEAEITTNIPKADSDYYDRDDNGVYEEGVDIPTPDGLSDIEEIYQYGTDVSNPDTDGDGMEDGWEAFSVVIQRPINGV